MMLKRLYSEPVDGQAQTLIGFETVHTGLERLQRFCRRKQVLPWIAAGFAELKDGTFVLKTSPEPLVYKVLREPGYFCTSSGERIPVTQDAWIELLSTGVGGLAAREARDWLAANGKAAGDYEVHLTYECELDEAQHEKWRAVRDGSSNVVAAHTLEA